jgi:hypothetical protein
VVITLLLTCLPPVQVLPQDLGRSSLVYHWCGNHSHAGEGSATALPMHHLFQLAGPIRPVNNSLSSDMKTVYLKVWDSKAGSAVKELIGRTVQFGKYACHIVKGEGIPGTPLCMRCWHWGHPFKICRAQAVCCPLCSKNHHEEHHHSMGSCCKEKPKATPLITATPAGNPCPHPARWPACGGPTQLMQRPAPSGSTASRGSGLTNDIGK